jgi:nicotinate-nucleotide pyrophosphorylase (carboxylating)
LKPEILEEVEEAINAKVDRIMLDNMDVATMTKAVKLINGKTQTEASEELPEIG